MYSPFRRFVVPAICRSGKLSGAMAHTNLLTKCHWLATPECECERQEAFFFSFDLLWLEYTILASPRKTVDRHIYVISPLKWSFDLALLPGSISIFFIDLLTRNNV